MVDVQVAAGKSTGASQHRDPFNWPSQNRKDTMSLASINPLQDLCQTRTNNMRLKHRGVSENLNSRDVPGAQPRVWAKQDVNKPDYTTNNCDIVGSGPRQLHFALDKPEFNLSTEGIQKSAPCAWQFKTTRQPSNPLNPQYKTQSFEYVAPEKPRMIRDQMTIDDIEGTRPKPRETGKAVRDPISVADIQGAGNRVPYTRKQPYDSLGYNEVYAKSWQTKRQTNPLKPEYTVRDRIHEGDFLKAEKTNVNAAYGAIDNNVPKALPNPRSGNRNLNTQDVGGSQADTKRLGAFTFYQRRADQVRNVTGNDDVFGSKPGSLRKSVVTTRVTNPLVPDYQIPGRGEVRDTTNNNDPYADFSKKKASTGATATRPKADSMAEVKSEASGGAFRKTGQSVVNSQAGSSNAQKLDSFIKA